MTQYTLVIPVYRNEESIPALVDAVDQLNADLDGKLECVFVVDGSPDRSHELLSSTLTGRSLTWRLIALSRNFGSQNAVREGLAAGRGPYFAVIAADLQEPPALVREFFRILAADEADVVVGTRRARADPFTTRFAAKLFWGFYRRFVQSDVPPGGVDVFACNAAFRRHLLAFREANTSLVGQIFWLGFRRAVVPYDRLRREHGRSSWTLARRLRYLADSIFAFTDFPIRVLTIVGILGLFGSVALGLAIFVARLVGAVDVPGYTATVLTILFLAALNSFGLGVIGSYVWRAYENTKARPLAITMSSVEHDPHAERP